MDRSSKLFELANEMIREMSKEDIESYVFDRLVDELDEQLSDEELFDIDMPETEYEQNGFQDEKAFWDWKEGGNNIRH